ncbi:PEP/pyruvate-binding domain-containing protein [Sutterella sp.]|uniref:PEP/pyruvate-binding domain-containing protein n=1 Tax=Sutterella sp. TaxID=1981025 RepID=UPI0026E0E1E0|nr:PEP/pyruvate-binding domain-containing protein [Sutterella sp.]MDO5531998.1 PEP/pyruvate-binding domain-containing protein [Sutterella sp.]
MTAPADIYGGKAHWTNWLLRHGFHCLPSLFVRCGIRKKDHARLRAELEKYLPKLGSSTLAVRSSGMIEDSGTTSKAGCYETVLGVAPETDAVFAAWEKVLGSAENPLEMGCVIQPMADCAASGVIFSSNPVSFSKQELVINYTSGTGDGLVSGSESGAEIVLRKADLGTLTGHPAWVRELALSAVRMESELNCPMDIEWCTERATGELIILQCRPVTSVLFREEGVFRISAPEDIPDPRLRGLDKVHLRLKAREESVDVSPAWLVCCNCRTEKFPLEETMFSIERGPFCRGYNAVVIMPALSGSKVRRFFVGDRAKFGETVTCNRYGVRSFPKHDSLWQAARAFYESLRNESWVCGLIIQEIFDPKYTGIIKSVDGSILVEITKGHFAAKGIVPSSCYIITGFEVTVVREVMQTSYKRIIEGHVIDQACNERVSLPADAILSIADYFRSFIRENYVVEFGVLEEEGAVRPYLIDYSLDVSDRNITVDDVRNGVISPGTGSGRLLKLEVNDLRGIDAHFHDELDASGVSGKGGKYICYAEKPSIELKDWIGPDCAGFVFASGASLCHLAVLLREHSIPAVTGVDEFELNFGAHYRLDTRRPGPVTARLSEVGDDDLL